jgi:hypothetical protein
MSRSTRSSGGPSSPHFSEECRTPKSQVHHQPCNLVCNPCATSIGENFLYVFKGAPLRGSPAADRPSGRACGLCGPIPARADRPPTHGDRTDVT